MPLPDLPVTEKIVIEMTNAFRSEHRLGAVAPNANLARAAKAYAEYLARSGKFAHHADGRDPAARTKEAGYRHCIVAENLALNQYTHGFETRELAAKAVEGWKGSPPHRAAMLNPHVIEIGVGIAKGPEPAPKYISVQLFGRPESLKFTFQVENATRSAVGYAFAGQQHQVPVNGWIAHTACTPGDLIVGEAKPVSRFEARNGTVFRLLRDGGGTLRVETQAMSGTDGAAAAKGARPPR